MPTTNQQSDEFQQFLDQNQYSSNSILRYEKIFGRGFVSTGGLETTEEIVAMLTLKPGQKVLDVGCGIGGSGFYMVKNFKVEVLGVDLSRNMIDIGKQRAKEFKDDKVEFAVADITTADYAPESFDVIYSRDTILHIADKEALFKNFLKWLKPGGELLISDYCRGANELSEQMKAYVAKRHYNLLTPADYGKLLEKVGFVDVKAIDNTERFVEVLRSERKRFETDKEIFLKDFKKEDFEYLVEDWETKIDRCGRGDQKWGLFHAKKSS
ncbi:phosphoethanolamine N-methyltransferase 1-like [Stylophora pistillata]|uniref:phosphoethanolamine N-methyltransferase n=1 Tax=Stylophora pistillata TaxID=50429 RepID=A0A2B4S389_STYPI|nr:phosphoethanolamine N-methyltransferase 1-like [Stylophora pistillata]PFX23067.1 Phosphoethanolamine N-methyltransferase 1 [Stylophora pistillata]